jgi:hypothetical protein
MVRSGKTEVMLSRIRKSLFSSLFICVLASVAAAQTNGHGTVAQADDIGTLVKAKETKPARAALPFAIGETLVYEGKFSKIIKGIAVADMTFNLVQAPNGDDYLVKAEAKSKGTLAKLFGYSFLQQIQSTINDDEFRAVKTVKHDVQKDRVRNSEALFDYQDRTVTFIETDPNEPMRPPRKIASQINGSTHDFISGLYSMRMMPLTVGNTFEFSVSDSGLVYNVPVKVTARERQKSIFGKVWAFRIEPQVFGPGRMIEREGSMIIWITDNARRIPIRAQVNTDFGRLEIKLKEAKNLK